MSSAIVPLMDTESAMLNALNIGADDGRKTENGMVIGMREKLIEMIRKADKEDHESQTQDVHYAFMADHLIANGVTIPVRCKDCKHRIYSDFDGCYVCHHGGFNAINPDHFCSYGERRTDDI